MSKITPKVQISAMLCLSLAPEGTKAFLSVRSPVKELEKMVAGMTWLDHKVLQAIEMVMVRGSLALERITAFLLVRSSMKELESLVTGME